MTPEFLQSTPTDADTDTIDNFQYVVTTARAQVDSLPDRNEAIMMFPDRCSLRMERWMAREKEGRKAGRMQWIRGEKG